MVPALTGTNRMADQDIMLGGYLIPKNTMIWCNLNAMFSSPDVWHEPDRYIPVIPSCQSPDCPWGVSVDGRREPFTKRRAIRSGLT